jgi:DNA-binding NtrC family response regulator
MTQTQTKKQPILLVDDEPEILFSLQGLLRREFELYTAESGAQALKILQQHPIHVIMSDQRMPEMTGFQLMHRVKKSHPAAIRIVFTGYADIRAVVDAINNVGLYRYITKPWDPDELIEVLHQAAARYEELVEHERLLTDVRQYVQQGQQLVQGLGEHPPAAGFAVVNLDEFAAQGSQLLQRLDVATSRPPNPAAGR